VQFSRELRRLMIGVLIAFGLVALSAAYWAIVGPDTLLQLPDNPRLVEAEAAIVRGKIVDRHDRVLVTSEQGENNSVNRHYLYSDMNSALGYFSLRYGVGGAEAAYNTILRGDDLPRDYTKDMLHLPKVGSDVRLSFDLDVQHEVNQALGGKPGALVVIAVPSGEILALVSLPTYDPNTLDRDWESLKTAPGNPFFNRVLQGSYQPGGMLQTPLLAAALLGNMPLDAPIDNAAAPITVDKVTLNCAKTPPKSALTLGEAYTFACPLPFAQLVEQLGTNKVEDIFNAFRVNHPPTLSGFVAVPAEATPEAAVQPSPSPTVAISPLENALGQGQLTTTPLEMATIMAAILNEGNAPTPHTLLATRKPETTNWIPADETRTILPFTTRDAAHQLEVAMRQVVKEGAAQAAARPGIDIGGHAALAYSGEGSQAWFIGFARIDQQQGVVVAVVIENSADPAEAAAIGGSALQAGYNALR
jgi:peptidoglycan glycosyltransferase